LLVVEDDDVTIDFLRFVLSEKYKVSTAENGPEALKLIKDNQFDAIIMDINLGRGMNGLDVVAELRKLPAYEKIPVIAVTAFALEGDKEEFINAGCDYYLSKPFMKNDLLVLVEEAIRTGRPDKAGLK
jgi:CheY-like chemotaxis protein